MARPKFCAQAKTLLLKIRFSVILSLRNFSSPETQMSAPARRGVPWPNPPARPVASRANGFALASNAHKGRDAWRPNPLAPARLERAQPAIDSRRAVRKWAKNVAKATRSVSLGAKKGTKLAPIGRASHWKDCIVSRFGRL